MWSKTCSLQQCTVLTYDTVVSTSNGPTRCYSQGGTTLHLKEASMRKMLLAVSAMTLMTSGIVFAQAETPVIDQRQTNQE